MFCEFTIDLLLISRIYYGFTHFFANSLSIHKYIIFYANSPQFSVFIANLVQIHVMFREFTMILLDVPRIYYLFTIFREFVVNSVSAPRIHYLLRKYTINSPSYTTMNSLSVSRIHYLFDEFTMNLLGFLWFTMDFREITINSVPGPWIHYLLRLYTMNSPSFFATQLWFYFLFHEFASYFAKLQ